jgi:SOS response associated peptidase (SRAP)
MRPIRLGLRSGIAPSWNVAPTDPLPVVRYDARASERTLDVMRWGLVPFWAREIKVGFSNINAKAEGIEGKPAFREAFQQRRCLVPVDNFYEWKKTATGKQPYAIALADRGLMALAGLWETWRFTGGRESTHLCDHHDDAERAVRGASQPDASGLKSRSVADLAWRGTRRCAAAQSSAGALPVGGDGRLAGQPAGRQRQE